MTATAAMVALSVILCRFLGVAPEGALWRFELGFLPLAFIGRLFGPWYSGIGYLVADIIGSFVHGYAPNPWISLCKLATGFIMGLFFHKRRFSLSTSAAAFLIIGFFIDFLMMSPIFIFMYGNEPSVAFLTRAVNAAVNAPLRITVLYLLGRASEKQLCRIADKFEKKSAFKVYANSFQAVTVPGLSRVRRLCELVGNPEKRLKFIHVAGTNGKGSVCSALALMLQKEGFKTGKYISPNLIRVNERISVDGVEISDSELSLLLDELSAPSMQVERELKIAPTQFEIWTAAAFLYFERQSCDYVVLEVGLGGELDATNVIESNEIAVITRLGLDHTQYLGNTLADVARAKCGIIKENCRTATLVTAKQEPEAMEIIQSATAQKGQALIVAEPEYLGSDGIHERFSVSGMENLTTGIPGLHQVENAALAVAAARALGVSETSIYEGVRGATNPARFEIIQSEPTVIFDGGHNNNGIEALVRSLDRYFPDEKKTVIYACMADKDISDALRMLAAGDSKFIFTTVKDNPRALSAEGLKERAMALGILGEACENIKDAYSLALSMGRLTVICGSLYLYKDVMELFYGKAHLS